MRQWGLHLFAIIIISPEKSLHYYNLSLCFFKSLFSFFSSSSKKKTLNLLFFFSFSTGLFQSLSFYIHTHSSGSFLEHLYPNLVPSSSLPRFSLFTSSTSCHCCSAGALMLLQNKKITSSPYLTPLDCVKADDGGLNWLCSNDNDNDAVRWSCCCCCYCSFYMYALFVHHDDFECIADDDNNADDCRVQQKLGAVEAKRRESKVKKAAAQKMKMMMVVAW